MSTTTVSSVDVAKAMSVSLKSIAYAKIRADIEAELRPYIEQWIKDIFKDGSIVKYDSYKDLMTTNTKHRFVVEMETNENPFA